MQSKTHSLVESVTNIIVGYFVALGAQLVVFPMFGLSVPVRDNILIGLVFTVVSLVRSYVLRRIFNRL
jgi:membrane protein CcdC involved in cytochrome C biogenesis